MKRALEKSCKIKFKNFLRALCEDNTNWEIEFEGKKTKVWSRKLPDSPLQMYKSKSEFKDVQADVCYDVLQVFYVEKNFFY